MQLNLFNGNGMSWLHASHQHMTRKIMAMLLILGIVQFLAWLTPVPEELRGISGFLPLHTLLETIAIVIAMLVFAIGWNAHSRNQAGNIVLLACVFFAVGWLDFSHALSYKGMPDFVTPSDPEKGVDFWLAARFLASLALLVVAIRPWHPFASAKTRYLLMGAGIAVVFAVNWLVLFHQEEIPHTFIPGTGLTPLKINLEYLFIALNLATALALLIKMRKPLPFNAPLLLGAVSVIAMSEFFFTLYASVTDIFNVLGHIYKVIAYLLIYRAIVVEGIETPYKKLTEAQQNLALSVQASNTGLWNWRTNSDEVYYSPEWKAQLGYQPDELANHFSTWERLLHPEDKDKALERVQNYIASSDKFYESEFRMRHHDGSYRWILARGEKQLDAKGNVTHLVGSHIDITERKRAEEELDQYRRHLEELVATRTAELTAARDAAESSNNAKSEFLASMSHELRTPLNAILGHSQLFSFDATLSTATKEQAHEIEVAGKHLLALINDMIDLARIEAGKLELSMEFFPLNSVIIGSLGMVASQAGKHGIELINECGSRQDEKIHADRTRLSQVVINLLSNAIKYNRPQGSVRVSCQSSNGKVRISVADTGLGIPADKHDRIFNAFDRLGRENGSVEGTGIGLIITKRIVESMGGAIGFESSVGQGSTFWVEFNIADAA